jgi:hypothetical protein
MNVVRTAGKFIKISEMVNGIDPGIKIENVKSLKS